MERNDEELLKRFYLLVKESFGRSPDPTGNHLRAAAQPEIHSLIKTGYDSVLTPDAVDRAVTLLCRASSYGNGDGAFIDRKQLGKLYQSLSENKPVLLAEMRNSLANQAALLLLRIFRESTRVPRELLGQITNFTADKAPLAGIINNASKKVFAALVEDQDIGGLITYIRSERQDRIPGLTERSVTPATIKMVADLCLAEGGERHEKFTRMRNLYSIACLVSKDPDPTFAAAIKPCHIWALANHSIENGNISYFNHEVYFFQIQALAEIIPAWRDALAGETTNKAYTKFTAEGGIIGEPKRETRPGTWPTEEIWMRTEGLDVKAAQTQRIVKDAIFQFLRQQQRFADNTGPVSHYDLAWKYDHIVAPLVTHNIGLGALDPTGQKTDAEMRQTVVEFFAALGRAGPGHLQKFCNDHPDIGSDVLEAAAGKGSASRPSTTPDPTPSQFKK